MEKIEVTICTGTTCYVMGAGSLLMVGEALGEDQRRQIEIKGANCLGLCKEGRYGQAPFVKVGDTLIPEATTEILQMELEKRLCDRERG